MRFLRTTTELSNTQLSIYYLTVVSKTVMVSEAEHLHNEIGFFAMLRMT